jgi:hypothetical protein
VIVFRTVLGAAVLLTMAILPAATLAADPPLRTVAITAPAGQIGALVTPVPVIVTNTGDAGGLIRIDNTSALSEDVSISVTDYVVDEHGKPGPAPADYPFGSSGWYRFESPSFTLPPASSVDVPFELAVPFDAGAGDHFAALNVRVQASPGQQPAADGASAQSVILIQNRLQHRVAGAQPETPALGLTATSDFGQVHFAARVNNSGNTVLTYQQDPTPTISLYDMAPWGNPSSPAHVLAVKGFYVAPESERLVAIDWTDAPIIGSYRAVLTLPEIDGLPSVLAETQVIVVNLPLLAAVAGAMLLGLIGLLFGVRHKRRSQVYAGSDGRPARPRWLV